MIRGTYPLQALRQTANGGEGRPEDTRRAALEPRHVTTFFRRPSFRIAVKGAGLGVHVRAGSASAERHAG